MFDRLNNYHSNIKLTIEVNPSNFLDTKLTNINTAFEFNVYQKKKKNNQNYLDHGPPKLQNVVNEIQSMVIFIYQKEYHEPLMKNFL